MVSRRLAQACGILRDALLEAVARHAPQRVFPCARAPRLGGLGAEHRESPLGRLLDDLLDERVAPSDNTLLEVGDPALKARVLLGRRVGVADLLVELSLPACHGL